MDAALRGGLVLAATVGLPLAILWTAAEKIADWHLPTLAPPWAQLVPLIAGALFLLASVRGLLGWLEGTLEAPARDDATDAGPRPRSSRPCVDCPA